MRLSRSRVVLRIALLAGVGLVFLVRAVQGWRGAGEGAPSTALQPRLALMQGLLALVAFLAAVAATSSLRRRHRVPTFRLGSAPIPDVALERSGSVLPRGRDGRVARSPFTGAAEGRSAPTGRKEDPMKTVPPGIVDGPTAQQLAEEGAVVLDVRTAGEFAGGHVPGARNIPHDEVGRRAGEIGPPSTPVVVYCGTGKRSGFARQELVRLGFDRVWDVQRLDAWPRGQ